MAPLLFDEGEDETGASEGREAEDEAVELSVERKSMTLANDCHKRTMREVRNRKDSLQGSRGETRSSRKAMLFPSEHVQTHQIRNVGLTCLYSMTLPDQIVHTAARSPYIRLPISMSSCRRFLVPVERDQ